MELHLVHALAGRPRKSGLGVPSTHSPWPLGPASYPEKPDKNSPGGKDPILQHRLAQKEARPTARSRKHHLPGRRRYMPRLLRAGLTWCQASPAVAHGVGDPPKFVAGQGDRQRAHKFHARRGVAPDFGTVCRVRRRIATICRWVFDGMPLPLSSTAKTVKHHPALPWQEMPSFMSELRQRDWHHRGQGVGICQLDVCVDRRGALLGLG